MIDTRYQVKIPHTVNEKFLHKFFHLFLLEIEKDTTNPGQDKVLKPSIFQFPCPILIQGLGIAKHGWHQTNRKSHHRAQIHPKLGLSDQYIDRNQ